MMHIVYTWVRGEGGHNFYWVMLLCYVMLCYVNDTFNTF